MTQHKVVYAFIGLYDTQNAVTPVSLLEDFTGDFNETVDGIRSHDDNGYQEYTKYSVRTVEIPDCFTFDEFKHFEYEINFILCSHKRAKNLSGKVIRWAVIHLIHDDGYDRAKEVIKLICQNTKSNFRMSLKNQIYDYIHTDPDDRKYTSPLSPNQWQSLMRYTRYS